MAHTWNKKLKLLKISRMKFSSFILFFCLRNRRQHVLPLPLFFQRSLYTTCYNFFIKHFMSRSASTQKNFVALREVKNLGGFFVLIAWRAWKGIELTNYNESAPDFIKLSVQRKNNETLQETTNHGQINWFIIFQDDYPAENWESATAENGKRGRREKVKNFSLCFLACASVDCGC